MDDVKKDDAWAPERIWLQREQGDCGSHTWCEDSVGDGDMIEEVAYVRTDLAKRISEVGQTPVAWLITVKVPGKCTSWASVDRNDPTPDDLAKWLGKGLVRTEIPLAATAQPTDYF